MAPWVPGASYRLQLDARFGFDDARRLLPYLARLGIETIYLSPVLAARRGSSHGYDGIDPGRIDPERGGESGFHRLTRAARAQGFAVLLDIVPNHLAATPENRAWRDVLVRGPASPFADLFDIDWERSPGGVASISLPWLEHPLAESFRRGELAFERARAGFRLRCEGVSLPIPAATGRALARWVSPAGSGHPGRRGAGERTLARLNRGRDRSSRRARDALVRGLGYRLVPWRDRSAPNYRRFADVSDLVGVRSADPRWFDYLHRRLLRAVRDGEVDGFRVDHVDGLADPGAYLRRLRRAAERARRGTAHRPFYLVVEKILGPEEPLPKEWPVHGTTGYDDLARFSAVLIPRSAAPLLDTAYRRACPGRPTRFADVVLRARRDVERALFRPERTEIARQLRSTWSPAGPRPSRGELDGTISALTATLPVYRTYLTRGTMRPEDRAVLRYALRKVRRSRGWAGSPATRWLGPLLREMQKSPGMRGPGGGVERWQSWMAAVAAKGGEDTAFYRYGRLLGVNEVGGDPARVGISLAEFHAFQRERARRWPHALVATSTHDTKWGEDVRARSVALAEFAEEWGRAAARWRRRHRRYIDPRGGTRAPTPEEEYRLYQVWATSAAPGEAFGASYRARLPAHLRKAAREAKEETSWQRPDRAHEARLDRFVLRLFRDASAEPFRDEMADWIRRLAWFGGYYSLAQTVLRNTVPGVPDLYQGSEAFNLSLVDPDNRRPVRFDRLARWLDSIDGRAEGGSVPVGLRPRGRQAPSAKLKIAVTAALLRFRAGHRPLFDAGEYLPLRERPPPGREPVLGFARRQGGEWVVTVVGRGLRRVALDGRRPPTGPAWEGRHLVLPPDAPVDFRDLLFGRQVRAGPRGGRTALPLDRALADLPVAVLYGTSTPRLRRPRAAGRAVSRGRPRGTRAFRRT